MVVNWTDKLPDREGYWLMAYKITNKFWQGEEWIVEICTITGYDDNLDYYCNVVTPRYGSLDKLLGVDTMINNNNRDDYILKFSSSPIQILNVDWNYKYET